MGTCNTCGGLGRVRSGRSRVQGSYRTYEEVTCTACAGTGTRDSYHRPPDRQTPDGGRRLGGSSSSSGVAFLLLIAIVVVWAMATNRSPDSNAPSAEHSSPDTRSSAAAIPETATAATSASSAPTEVSPATPPALPSSAPLEVLQGPLSPEMFDTARLLDLTFYPSAQLWEFSRWGTDVLAAYLVPADGPPIALDGTPQRLYEYNARIGLKFMHLDAAVDYVRFVSAFVWEEEGPNRIIETREALPSSAPHDPNAQPQALRGEPSNGGVDVFGLVLYGDGLFNVLFRLEPGGIVFAYRQPLVKGLAQDVSFGRGQRRPASVAGLRAGIWPLPPPVPGNWRNATGDEMARVKQLILSERARISQ